MHVDASDFPLRVRYAARVGHSLRARDIMKGDVVTIDESASIGEAMHTLVEHGFRHLPIVRDGVPVGVLSDRDLRRFEGVLAAEVADPGDDEARLALPAMALLDSGEPIGVAPDAPARDVVDLMLEHKIGAVLVVEGGKLVGIVTTLDVLRAACEHL